MFQGIKGFAGDSRGNQKFRVQVSDGIHCGAGMLLRGMGGALVINSYNMWGGSGGLWDVIISC